jgi:nitrite reductase (NADH) large subunit
VAGQNAAGQSAAFSTIPRSNTLKVLGIDLFSTGQIAPAGPEDTLLETQDEQTYRGFIFHAGRLAGAILLGEAAQAAAVKQAVEEGRDCSALLAKGASAAQVLETVAA